MVETDPQQGVTTTFTLSLARQGKKTFLIIATTAPVSKGVMGWMERQISRWVLRRIY